MSLVGKRIVVTRAVGQATDLVSRLEDAGAIPLRCPTIAIEAPTDWTDLDAALARIEEYEWVVFTSSNGVRWVASRWREVGGSIQDLSRQRVAAVGPNTARVLNEFGVEPEFVPAAERSRALADSIPDVEGAEVLLARADIADVRLSGVLLDRGARRVDDVIAYRTLLRPPAGPALEELRRGVDGITFTSPSTVRGLLELGPEARGFLGSACVVTLGPAASEALSGHGFAVDAEAADRSMSGLVAALESALEERNP